MPSPSLHPGEMRVRERCRLGYLHRSGRGTRRPPVLADTLERDDLLDGLDRPATASRREIDHARSQALQLPERALALNWYSVDCVSRGGVDRDGEVLR